MMVESLMLALLAGGLGLILPRSRWMTTHNKEGVQRLNLRQSDRTEVADL
jgi:hypothetical protein